MYPCDYETLAKLQIQKNKVGWEGEREKIRWGEKKKERQVKSYINHDQAKPHEVG